MNPGMVSAILPLVVIGIVFGLRYRNIGKPRPFRPNRLWIMPVLMLVVMTGVVLTLPPTAPGWLALAGGFAIGAFFGWRRGHMMHLDRDPETGGLLIRQSPAALILMLAIIASKRLFTYGMGVEPGATPQGHVPAGALIVTDGLIGFALGMVLLMRWTLWQRAKEVPHHDSPVEGA